MAIAFGKNGDVADNNMPYSLIKRWKKKLKAISVYFAGLADTEQSVFGGVGVVTSFTVYYAGVGDSSKLVFLAGGAA